MKIKKAEELVNVLINDFSAVISSADEINTYPQYSLENDNEHDYKLLYKVLKMNYAESLVNPYDVIFYIIFSKNGGIFEVKGLGVAPKKMNKLWRQIEWEKA